MNNKKEIVILGGGFAGLTALHHLHKNLGSKVNIKLIDKRKTSVNRPTLPEVALAGKPAKHAVFPFSRAIHKSEAEFINAAVKKIDSKNQKVYLSTDKAISYDYLLVAMGAVHDYDAIPGFNEYAYSVCDVNKAKQLWKRMKSFKGGNVVVGSSVSAAGSRVDAPKLAAVCEGPVGEIMFMVDQYLRREKLREKSSIRVFSPAEIFFEDVGPKVHEVFGPIIEKHNIEVITNKIIESVSETAVHFKDGSKLDSDLSIVLPPYTVAPVIKESGLGDEAGYLPTDKQMRHLDYGNIFAAGDVNAWAIPKLGHIATLQAEIAAKAIAKELGANTEIPEFKPEILCIMNRGGHEATMIYSDYLWGGDIDSTFDSPIAHMMKWGFDAYYGYTRGHLPPAWTGDLIERFLKHD